MIRAALFTVKTGKSPQTATNHREINKSVLFVQWNSMQQGEEMNSSYPHKHYLSEQSQTHLNDSIYLKFKDR
jgi:hypothetical protein